MARNKSEKSPSGDPMVDECLRAWLRWSRSRRNVTHPARTRELSDLECRAYEQLIPDQLRLRAHIISSGGIGTHLGLMKIYGHEPEFQDGAQSK